MWSERQQRKQELGGKKTGKHDYYFLHFQFFMFGILICCHCFSSSLVRVTQTPFSHTEVVTDGLQMRKNKWKTEFEDIVVMKKKNLLT